MDQLTKLEEKVRARLKEAVGSDDDEATKCMVEFLEKLKRHYDAQHRLDEQREELIQLWESDWGSRSVSVANTLNSGSVSNSNLKGFVVEIRWDSINLDGGTEVFNERTAAATLLKVCSTLYNKMGRRFIAAASKTRVNRGMLISDRPEIDFCSADGSQVYTNKEILGSGYYVLTHSSTLEKAGNLRKLFRELLPSNAYTIRII